MGGGLAPIEPAAPPVDPAPIEPAARIGRGAERRRPSDGPGGRKPAAPDPAIGPEAPTPPTPRPTPAAPRDWLETITFSGRLCETGTDVTIDVAVVYTPAARLASGGAAAIEAEIDLAVSETNQAYRTSGVHHRIALVERWEVAYVETGDSAVDLRRLWNPSDGHLDEVHALRDGVGAW